MTPEEFEQKVAEGVSVLPERVREQIKNVVLLVDEEPSAEVRTVQKLKPNQTLLGLYKGIPLSRRGIGYGGLVMPDSITLFRKPILETAGRNRKEIEKVIAETILHEFAHHLGMNEEEVRDWERHHELRGK